MKKTEYLIIGQGLAGTLLAYFLMKKGKEVIVIDEDRVVTSSKIAAGMFNPISGKRMVKSKLTDTLLSCALQTYRGLETFLGVKILHIQSIYNVFGSIKEQNDLSLKLDDASFSGHIDLHPQPEPHLRQPFGAFEINGSGWVDTALLLSSLKEKLIFSNRFVKEEFVYPLLKRSQSHWEYKDLIADHIIFCEGARAIQNPFFKDLPFQLCKGDILTIKCEGLGKARIIKKGIYLVHLHDEIYKVGSTNEWNDLSETPTAGGKNMLAKKLDELLDVPYTILSHEAAIRPTTRTREPFIAKAELKNMYMLNGLGTKGVMTGPWWVKKLVETLI